MTITIDDVNILLQYLRECIEYELGWMDKLNARPSGYEDYYLVRKNCVGNACGRWLKRYSKYRRVYVGRCVDALYRFFEHKSKDVLLEHLMLIFRW